MSSSNRVAQLASAVLILGLGAADDAQAKKPVAEKSLAVQGTGYRGSLLLNTTSQAPAPSNPTVSRTAAVSPPAPPPPAPAAPPPPTITTAAPSVMATASPVAAVAPTVPAATIPAATNETSISSLDRAGVAPSRVGAQAYGRLTEVLPGQDALAASFRPSVEATAGRAPSWPLRAVVGTGQTLAPASCVRVELTLAADRPGRTWVDLTGDRLIVSAVDSAHAAAVLARAGAWPEAGPHCLPQALLKDLLRGADRPAAAASMTLEKVAEGWRLGSPAQAAVASTSARSPKSVKRRPASNDRLVAKG